MVTQHDLLTMTPCNSLEAKASYAAFEPLAFLFSGEKIYNPFFLPTGEAVTPLAYGFKPMPGLPNKLFLPSPTGGFIFIDLAAVGTQAESGLVTRVDSNGRVLAVALNSQLPRTGDISIAKVAQRYITLRMLEVLSFVFEETYTTDPFSSDCGRFDTSPLEYGFLHATDSNGSPCLIRDHEEGGHLQISFVETVDGAESGPLLNRYDAAGNVMASVMVSHLRAVDPELSE